MREPYFAIAVIFIMAGTVALTKNCKSSKKEFNENKKSLTVSQIIFMIFGIIFILSGLYLIIIISYFQLGFALILSGLIGVTAKFKLPKEWFWDDYYDSENAQRVMRIIGVILSVLLILFGLYLIAKGVFSPFTEGMWF